MDSRPLNAIDPYTAIRERWLRQIQETQIQPKPTTSVNEKIISMLLTDTLNGWKW
jgi:hypothetical protein